MEWLIKIGISLGIVVFGFILGPLLKKGILALSKTDADKGPLTFVGSCISALTKIIAGVIALSHLGVDTNVIVGAFSAMGLGISLALKDNMANVAGGIQVLFTRPFIVGDYISVEAKEGTVARIEMMFTVLRTPSNQEIIVPNSALVQDVIVNYSKEKYRRILIHVPCSLDTDVSLVRELILSILEMDVDVSKTHPYEVAVDDIQDNGLSLGVYAWVRYEKYWDCLHRLNEEIQKKRIEQGIKGPMDSIRFVR